MLGAFSRAAVHLPAARRGGFFLRDVAHVLSPSADKPDFSHPLNHQLMQPLSEDATSSTGLLCGFLSFQPGLTDLLLAALPDTLLLAGPDLLASETRTVFDLIMSEMRAEQEVNPLVIERLVELLLFYTLRYYAEHGHANYALPYGVLELAKDNAYGPLLSAIVREPALAWSVDDMADFLHTSRASFHRRFTLLSGLAPAQLLLNIRVQLSKALLTEGLSVEQVAERMGYASAPTFSNAFKRVMGLTPSVWRDGK
ncbi:AraC family transcriptional regulator [Paenalcaligenes niemegkensis]|nr:AraC family transcriptional regulator [Paenalcaligenes niemegkensis]MCQ9616655.1 AraC family transcriptional regulator [Paenalcaligenes niemegkensis]